MKRTIFVLMLSQFGQIAQAMPTGTFDCISLDGTLSVGFYVSNYGEHVISNLEGLTIGGKHFDLANGRVQVDRQWIEGTVGNVDVSLPKEQYFSKNLVIKTRSSDGYSYDGKGRIEVRERDYSDAEKVLRTFAVKCELVP